MKRDNFWSWIVLTAVLSFVSGFGLHTTVAGQPPLECKCDPCPDPCPTSEITGLAALARDQKEACDETLDELSKLRSEMIIWRNDWEQEAECPTCTCDCGPEIQQSLGELESQLRNRWFHTIGVGGGYGESFDGTSSLSSPRGTRLAHVGFIVTPTRWITVGASYGRVWDTEVDVYCGSCEIADEAKLDDTDVWLVNAYLHPFRKSK